MLILAKPHDHHGPTAARVAGALAAPAGDPEDGPCGWRNAGHCHRTAWGFAGRCDEHPRTASQVARAVAWAATASHAE